MVQFTLLIERELRAKSVPSSSVVKSNIASSESLYHLDRHQSSKQTLRTDTKATTALAYEEMNDAEPETLIPTIALPLATRDVGQEVAESKHSSGVVKPIAFNSPTAALGSEEVSNTDQETLVPVIPPTRDTPTTRDVAHEVAEAASSSGVTKPIDTHATFRPMTPIGDASDRPTVLVSDEVMNFEQEAFAPMIAPTCDTLTTPDLAGEVAEAASSSGVTKPTDTHATLPLVAPIGEGCFEQARYSGF